MKPSTLKRKKPLRSNPAKRLRSKTKLKAFNPEKSKKRRTRQQQKHEAYRKSDTYREVEARSGGRCEFSLRGDDVRDGFEWQFHPLDGWIRCGRKATQHHHRTYARYGGQELRADICHGCAECHKRFEELYKSYRRARRRREQL